MDITTKTETELKALKCDAYETIALNQQNIAIINDELKKRAQNKKINESGTENAAA